MVEGFEVIGGHMWVSKGLDAEEESEEKVAWNEAIGFANQVGLYAE